MFRKSVISCICLGLLVVVTSTASALPFFGNRKSDGGANCADGHCNRPTAVGSAGGG